MSERTLWEYDCDLCGMTSGPMRTTNVPTDWVFVRGMGLWFGQDTLHFCCDTHKEVFIERGRRRLKG